MILTLYTGILWKMICSDLMMDLVNTFGFIFNVPRSYLGNLVISLGDPITDTIGGCRLAREG